MFTLRETGLPGCFEVLFKRVEDARGAFIKTFHAKAFASNGLETAFVEQYYTTSKRGVLRGLHFQVPPEDHAKLVYCISGTVFDAVLDLRRSSGTCGKFAHVELSAEKANALYIPRGLAHGFAALTDCTMVYNVTSVHAPACDAGIRYDSAGIPWPGSDFVLSERDRAFPALADFDSPFNV